MRHESEYPNSGFNATCPPGRMTTIPHQAFTGEGLIKAVSLLICGGGKTKRRGFIPVHESELYGACKPAFVFVSQLVL